MSNIQDPPSEEKAVKDTIDPKDSLRSRGDDYYGNGASRGSDAASYSHLPAAYSSGRDERECQSLDWRERIRHFTWAFFTMTMATGGIANVINSVPFRFHGLYGIGCIFVILNIVLFISNICIISLRFYLYPYTFRASFLHPTESLFVPTTLVSLGTIFMNITQYGIISSGYWLNITSLVLFWIYSALAFVLSFSTYLVIWSTQTFTISSMTPAWIFPAYPLLLVGPYAGSLSNYLEPSHSITLMTGGITLQILGFLVAYLMYAAYMYRLMTQNLPEESSRPSMFVSVGPAGFTATALINIAKSANRVFFAQFMGSGDTTAMISKVLANWMGICLWALALWFFFISLGSHYSVLKPGSFKFTITWWSFIFPNTALTTATFAVANAFSIPSLKLIGCVMTCILIAGWMFVFGMMIRAIVKGDILMPQKGEDKDEGGWEEEKELTKMGSRTREEANKRKKEKAMGRRRGKQSSDVENGHA